jgi:ATP-binding cassette subfamily B (MDR/TAP) protein 1
MMASMNFGMSSAYIEAFSIAKGAGAKVFSVIDRISPISSWSEDGKRPEQMNGNISFRDIHFEYPTRAEVKVTEHYTKACLLRTFICSYSNLMYNVC